MDNLTQKEKELIDKINSLPTKQKQILDQLLEHHVVLYTYFSADRQEDGAFKGFGYIAPKKLAYKDKKDLDLKDLRRVDINDVFALRQTKKLVRLEICSNNKRMHTVEVNPDLWDLHYNKFKKLGNKLIKY